ncbi:DUF1996 domain-containing protein [Chlorogloeopsis fritschii PCC 9212]|uniref:DUF1996 domain-containing protein n=1 Tax=Chlorogloeopsis fritschii PCC 6912 TaxID=211165 RepID=A0A433N9A5_CHLFR|nr:DUF1996 domain-containing protein [Chlorogloeopsis fritschii]MBF2008578.1 DUF1996 domain-containing protein [Chlorogloeopsis fritschii C42_A2020_084]RUR78333.1 hypothetical protein PCC6912_36750 [Chlorogloeopsis fritschii PCC 6912]
MNLDINSTKVSVAKKSRQPLYKFALKFALSLTLVLLLGFFESSQLLASSGSSDFRVRSSSEQTVTASDGVGAFRTLCDFSHMNNDDAIIFPGQSGKSHSHTYFGNTQADAFSSYDSLRSSGNSTCRGGSANRTAYWVPTLFDKQGQAIKPAESHFYYKSGYFGIAASQINEIPDGLKMVVGNAQATSSQNTDILYWGCWNRYVGKSGSIQKCDVGDFVVMNIDFPQCWDGVNLDSSDHKSHVVFPVNGACPSTHSVAIPNITMKVLYPVPSDGDVSGWRLSSDSYGTDQPGGYSIHGDWFDGWDTEIKDAWTNNCVKKGIDCHSNLLGDGRELY